MKKKAESALHSSTPLPSDTRRYLVNIDAISTHQLFSDCLVVGAGIAGLRAALEAAQTCKVILLCKSHLQDSNTWKAQGGIASVLDKSDSIADHVADTLKKYERVLYHLYLEPVCVYIH